MLHGPEVPTQRREFRGKIAISRFISFGLLDETNEERDPILQQTHRARYSALKFRIPTGHEIEASARIRSVQTEGGFRNVL